MTSLTHAFEFRVHEFREYMHQQNSDNKVPRVRIRSSHRRARRAPARRGSRARSRPSTWPLFPLCGPCWPSGGRSAPASLYTRPLGPPRGDTAGRPACSWAGPRPTDRRRTAAAAAPTRCWPSGQSSDTEAEEGVVRQMQKSHGSIQGMYVKLIAIRQYSSPCNINNSAGDDSLPPFSQWKSGRT